MSSIEKIPFNSMAAGMEGFSAVQKSSGGNAAPAQRLLPPARPDTAAPGAGQQFDEDEFRKRLEKLNDILDVHNIRLSFGLDEGVFWMKVIDLETGKVVRQVPSPEMMDFLNRTEDAIAMDTYLKHRLL